MSKNDMTNQDHKIKLHLPWQVVEESDYNMIRDEDIQRHVVMDAQHIRLFGLSLATQKITGHQHCELFTDNTRQPYFLNVLKYVAKLVNVHVARASDDFPLSSSRNVLEPNVPWSVTEAFDHDPITGEEFKCYVLTDARRIKLFQFYSEVNPITSQPCKCFMDTFEQQRFIQMMKYIADLINTYPHKQLTVN